MLLFKKLLLSTCLLGGLVLVTSCKKTDNTPNNNNTPPTNPLLPVIGLGYYKTSGTPLDIIGINVGAKAKASGATVNRIFRDDSHGDTASIYLGGQDSVMDIYTLPTTVTSGTIDIKYTVTDSKGNSNSATAHVTVGGKPSTFAHYTKFTVLDQVNNPPACFLNTGGSPSSITPVVWQTGDVNADTSRRRLVDLVCVVLAGQSDGLIAPYDPGFDSIPMFHNYWTLSQRNKTKIVKLSSGFNVSTCTLDQLKTAVDAATPKKYRVSNPFSPSDVYGFITLDGRYGAFYVRAIGGGVLMDLAVQSR
jgi:hypothetical protein